MVTEHLRGLEVDEAQITLSQCRAPQEPQI